MAACGKLEHEEKCSELATVKQDHIISISQNPVFSKLATIWESMSQATRTKQGTFWFCEYERPFLYRMDDQKGKLNKYKLDVNTRDIFLHPVTDQLYCISSFPDSSVRTVDTRSMRTTKLFSAEDPFRMAVTRSGHILVTTRFIPKLTLYTSTGAVVQTVTSMPADISHISVCRATGNVAVSCRSSGLSVFTDTLQPIFTYPSDTIDAWDATFDNSGYILVADYNKTIHIIDATSGELQKVVLVENGYPVCLTVTTGQLQKVVLVENGYPVCLTVYSNDSVVVCTGDTEPQMISMKYLD